MAEPAVRDEKDRVRVFDTTLRDGEQSPGASMTREEKLRIARQLERLKVEFGRAIGTAEGSGRVGRCQASFREATTL